MRKLRPNLKLALAWGILAAVLCCTPVRADDAAVRTQAGGVVSEAKPATSTSSRAFTPLELQRLGSGAHGADAANSASGATGEQGGASRGSASKSLVSGESFVRTGAAMAVVLALLGLTGLGLRHAARKGWLGAAATARRGPSGVLEVLARYPAGGGVTMLVVKFDRRVLLVSQSSGRGLTRGGGAMTTLCELAEPEDVASILMKTRTPEQAQTAERFQKLLASEAEQADEALRDDAPARRTRGNARTHAKQVENVEAPVRAARTPAQTRPQTPSAAIRERLLQERSAWGGGPAHRPLQNGVVA